MGCWKSAWMALTWLSAAAAAQSLDPQEARLRAVSYVPKPAVTIRTRTDLVEIGVVVRDNHGDAVRGLTKADFEVRDEGRTREIAAFSAQSFVPAAPAAEHAPPAPGVPTPAAAAASQPRWLTMAFDDLGTPPADLYIAKEAAKRFLGDGLAANERVAVSTASGGLFLPFTADTAQISAAIDQIESQHRDLTLRGCPILAPYDTYLIATNSDPLILSQKIQEFAECDPSRAIAGRGAARSLLEEQLQARSRSLWEQIRIQSQDTLQTLAGMVDAMSALAGTRVLLVASSGFLSGTLEPDEDYIINKALRANVVINSLDAKGLYAGLYTAEMGGQGTGIRQAQNRQKQGTKPQEALNDVLGTLAYGTGGAFFHNRNDLDRGFRQLGAEPEASYLLGIAPEALDGKYHHLKVDLTGGRRFTVEARKGYVALAEARTPQQPALVRRLDREVFTDSTLSDAPVTVSAIAEKSPEGKQLARFTFHVDIGKVQFEMRDGVRSRQFRVIAALFDSNGAFVQGVEGELDFALKQASYERYAEPGFNADLRIPVPEGRYRLRAVVVEGDENGRYSMANQTVEFH